jgi:hypothetical protein
VFHFKKIEDKKDQDRLKKNLYNHRRKRVTCTVAEGKNTAELYGEPVSRWDAQNYRPLHHPSKIRVFASSNL